jgi:hypothetical protein
VKQRQLIHMLRVCLLSPCADSHTVHSFTRSSNGNLLSAFPLRFDRYTFCFSPPLLPAITSFSFLSPSFWHFYRSRCL